MLKGKEGRGIFRRVNGPIDPTGIKDVVGVATEGQVAPQRHVPIVVLGPARGTPSRDGSKLGSAVEGAVLGALASPREGRLAGAELAVPANISAAIKSMKGAFIYL